MTDNQGLTTAEVVGAMRQAANIIEVEAPGLAAPLSEVRTDLFVNCGRVFAAYLYALNAAMASEPPTENENDKR